MNRFAVAATWSTPADASPRLKLQCFIVHADNRNEAVGYVYELLSGRGDEVKALHASEELDPSEEKP